MWSLHALTSLAGIIVLFCFTFVSLFFRNFINCLLFCCVFGLFPIGRCLFVGVVYIREPITLRCVVGQWLWFHMHKTPIFPHVHKHTQMGGKSRASLFFSVISIKFPVDDHNTCVGKFSFLFVVVFVSMVTSVHKNSHTNHTFGPPRLEKRPGPGFCHLPAPKIRVNRRRQGNETNAPQSHTLTHTRALTKHKCERITTKKHYWIAVAGLTRALVRESKRSFTLFYFSILFLVRFFCSVISFWCSTSCARRQRRPRRRVLSFSFCCRLPSSSL